MEIGEGFKWVVGTLIAVATLGLSQLGISKLLELRTGRKYARQDKEEELHITNQAKQIDSDVQFRESLITRIEKLENKLEAMQTKQLELIETNATLKTENKNLREEKNRQEQEIKQLREDKNKQATEIINLKNTIHRLEGDLSIYKTQIEQLKAEFERMK